MDLVEQAGIDVSAWAFKRDPKDLARTLPVAKPRANPDYCYDWTFGDEAQGFVLCVWHALLKEVQPLTGPAIGYSENIRELALSLDRIAIDRTRDKTERNRARDQARRARAFDVALQRAFRKRMPVRLIINEGDRRPLDELGKSKSTVKLRALDAEPWFVHAYDEQGIPLLVRSIPPAGVEAVDGPPHDADLASVQQATPPVPAYVDQFSALTTAATREATVTVRERSAAVRERVLQRAAGHCEWCGRPGFTTLAGAMYLETHHVIPLADDGPDHETNVMALCPEDHRRAHYAHDQSDMTRGLLAKLATLCAAATPP